MDLLGSQGVSHTMAFTHQSSGKKENDINIIACNFATLKML